MSGGKSQNSNSIRRQLGKIYNLYLVNPKSGAAACGIAEKLIKISGVEEVLVTEGDYGFLVKARAQPENSKLYNAIQSHSKGDLRSVTAYYRYRK